MFNSENMMFLFFGVEIIIVIILLLVILVGKALFKIGYNYATKLYQKISKNLANSLVHNTPFDSQFHFNTYYSLITLLSVLEAFDHRFKGEEWDDLKNEVARKYLINQARRWSRSRFWVRRNFTARVFAITRYREDEPSALELMDDKVFLVRSIVSTVAVKNEVKDGIDKILLEMSKNKSYGYYYYRDLLVSGSEKVLLWVEEFATYDKGITYHLACLDVLENSYNNLSILSLEDDFSSKNPKLRLAACKIYANNPQPDSAEKLIIALSDSEPEIRAEATTGLKQFYSEETVAALKKALSDNDLYVRVQAALTLASFGDKGLRILKTEDASGDTIAYEAAQYALQFSEGL